MRISDWSSDVCSSDLSVARRRRRTASLWRRTAVDADREGQSAAASAGDDRDPDPAHVATRQPWRNGRVVDRRDAAGAHADRYARRLGRRSDEHTSELQSLMRISYADFCLKQKNQHKKN